MRPTGIDKTPASRQPRADLPESQGAPTPEVRRGEDLPPRAPALPARTPLLARLFGPFQRLVGRPVWTAPPDAAIVASLREQLGSPSLAARDKLRIVHALRTSLPAEPLPDASPAAMRRSVDAFARDLSPFGVPVIPNIATFSDETLAELFPDPSKSRGALTAWTHALGERYHSPDIQRHLAAMRQGSEHITSPLDHGLLRRRIARSITEIVPFDETGIDGEIADLERIDALVGALTKEAARKGGASAGTLRPLLELGERALASTLDHDGAHQLLVELLLASPEAIFKKHRGDILPGINWLDEHRRIQSDVQSWGIIMREGRRRFPGFEKAHGRFMDIAEALGHPSSAADFVRFLRIEAGLDFDHHDFSITPEGLAWARERNEILASDQDRPRWTLVGEVLAFLTDPPGSGGRQASGNDPAANTSTSPSTAQGAALGGIIEAHEEGDAPLATQGGESSDVSALAVFLSGTADLPLFQSWSLSPLTMPASGRLAIP